MSVWLNIACIVAIHSMLAVGAFLPHRFLGLVSVSHGAVAGTGAYAFALAVRQFHVSAEIALLIAVICGAASGAAITLYSLRSTDSDFALVTFATQLVWTSTMLTARAATGGALGISGVGALPGSQLMGELTASMAWAVSGVVVGMVVARWISATPFAVACAVVARSNELGATLGIPPFVIRLKLGLLYGGCLGAAGAFLASYLSFIDPVLFSTNLSVIVLAIVYLSARWGSGAIFLSALLVVGLPQTMRYFDVLGPRASYLQILLAGMIVCCWSLGKHKVDRMLQARGWS